MRNVYATIARLMVMAMLALPFTGYAQLSITAEDSPVTITFDASVSGVNQAQFLGTGSSLTPNDGQLDANAWGFTGFSDGDVDFGVGSDAIADYTKGASTGSVTSGGLYAFDVAGDGSNHAIGVQPTGTDFSPGSIRLKVVNNSGVAVNSVNVAYNLYVNNDADRSSTISGSYSIDNSTYIAASGLAHTTTEVNDANGWVAYAKETSIFFTTPLANGSAMYLAWIGDDFSGSGSRDEIALDDVTVTFNPDMGADPSINFALDVFNSNFGEVLEGEVSEGRQYSIIAENLTEDLVVTVPDQFEISTDNGTTYNNNNAIFTPASGQVNTTIFVRFAPTTAGTQSGEITHTSGTASQSIVVSGLALSNSGAIYSADFETCPDNLPAGWTTFSVSSSANWECTQFGRGTNSNGIQISGFNADADSEDWLISPAINMNDYPFEELSFWARTRFSGNAIQVKYSTDFAGGDPTVANWSDVTLFNMPEENSDNWQEVKADLSSVSGTSVNLAFVYTSTPSSAARWTIDDFYLISGDGIIELESISSLRDAGTGNGTTFRLTNEVVLTYQQSFRGQKYVQDATGAILIDDNTGIITSSYNINDGITGLTGTLGEFGGMLQFIPTEDPGSATSSGNVANSTTITVDELTTNFEDYEGQLVTIENVTFTSTGDFANGQVYQFTDGINTYNFRTTFYGVDYIGTTIPTQAVNLTGVPNSTSSGIFITARNSADIEILGGGSGTTQVTLIEEDFNDDCADITGWITYNEVGDNEWVCTSSGYNGTSGFEGNGFVSGTGATENKDWLISSAINAEEYTAETLNFWARTRFSGDAMQVLYSVDYSGSGDPNAANWVAVPGISLPAENSDEWTEVTGDLSSIVGTSMHIAFVYNSTTTAAARWRIDNIILTAEAPEGTVAVISADLTGFNSDFGSVSVGERSASTTYTVSGAQLTENLVITAPEGFEISTDNTNFANSLTLTPSGGSVSTTIYVQFAPTSAVMYSGIVAHRSSVARAQFAVSGEGVANTGGITSVAELRQQAIGGTYTLSSEVIMTYQQSFRGQKYVQDETGGILIDDSNGIITSTYNVNDGITGLTGTLGEFGGMLQFVPTQDPGAATSSNNNPTIVDVTLAELTTNFEDFEARLVRVKNVSFDNGGTFANGTVYGITGPTGSYNFRTTFFGVDYIGTEIPGGSLNLVGIPNSRNDGEYLSARNAADISVYIPEPVLILTENFDDCDITGWTTISVTGDQVWGCTDFGRNETKGYQANGFVSGTGPTENEDWLITPALDLTSAVNERLVFWAITRFGGDAIQVLYSTNYDGAGQPSSFNWTMIPGINLPAENSNIWTEVTGDLSGINSNSVHIAFVYTSSSSAAARWTIDDITVEDPGLLPAEIIVNSDNFSGAFGELAVGAASMGRAVSLSAINALGGLTVEASEGFEVSLDNLNFSSMVTIADIDGEVVNEMVYIRFAPTKMGSVMGSISFISGGTIETINVSGTGVGNSVELFTEDFSTCFPDNGWTAISVSSGKDWRCTSSGYNGSGAEINGFNQTETSDDWLISPSINMDANDYEMLSFYTEYRFGDENTLFELVYSNDYDGSGTVEAVQAANWQNVSFTKPATDQEWTYSGQIDLSSINGTTYLAFHYKAEANPRRWRLDEIMLSDERPVSIASVRSSNANGLSLYLNSEVTLTGVVHGVNSYAGSEANGLEFRLVDVAQEVGVTVMYNGAADLGYQVNEGDELTITGTVGNLFGLTTLMPSAITVNSTGNNLLISTMLEGNMLNENLESLPVRLEGATIIGGWEEAIDGVYFVTLSKNEVEYIVRFDSQLADWSGLFTIDALSLNGFGYQMDETMPYDGGYMLTVSGLQDVDILNSIEDDLLKQSVILYPNPNNTNRIFLKGLNEAASVTIFDMTGKIVSSETIYTAEGMDTGALPAGVYNVTLSTSKAKAVYRLIKQ